MTFDSLGLTDELKRAVHDTGYTIPTAIQSQAIPAILNGSDVMGAAQTGTGKTAGFTLPILQGLSREAKGKNRQPRALILTPTRELAAQVQESVCTYGKYLQLRSAVVFGGVNIQAQINKLRRGVDIVVATPGRLLDLHSQNALHLDNIEILVLDEADRMLDMGFIRDIKKIMALLPKQRQTLMFSATFSREIRQLAREVTNNPLEIDVAPRNTTVEMITQKVHPVDKARKAELLSYLVRSENWYQVLVFCRTKHGADKLVRRLSRDNIDSAAIHGNKSQGQRTTTLKRFKQNKTQVLVATDIAARGIDIDQLSHVVNYDMPHTPEDYIHRIGRTGRAGASGEAVSLVCADEIKQLQAIERLIKRSIEREELDGFEPGHQLPAAQAAEQKKKKHKPARRHTSKRKTASEPHARRRKAKSPAQAKSNKNPRKRIRAAETGSAVAV